MLFLYCGNSTLMYVYNVHVRRSFMWLKKFNEKKKIQSNYYLKLVR
jgi:hypothetical protein